MSSNMKEVLHVLKQRAPAGFVPKVGMILGSGLSSLAEQITDAVAVPYRQIPGLPTGGVAGHASELLMGYLNGMPVMCLRGRLHLYEGVAYDAVRTLVRMVKWMGADTLIVTGAVGSLRQDAGPGELMMIDDHINFHPGNPLVGHNDDTVGPRFVSMENAYDIDLQAKMQKAAKGLNIELHKGVYLSTLGPMFETPAEIRAFKKWGADVVGMSCVPEVILARHCGLKVACVTAITNAAAGMSDEVISHEGTLHFGEIGAQKLIKLIPAFLKELE
jgi:xanthosine phosphorylase